MEGIPTEEEILDCSKSLQSYVKELFNFVKKYNLEGHYQGMDEVLKRLKNKIDKFGDKAKETIDAYSVEKFSILTAEARK